MLTTLASLVTIISSAALAIVITPIVRMLAKRWKIVDRSELAPERKDDRGGVPLLGGWAVYLTFVAVCLTLLAGGWLADSSLPGRALVGLLIGGLLLLIGGTLDDKFNLRPGQQFIWALLASAVVIAAGVGVTFIANPLGEPIRFDEWKLTVFQFNGIDYQVMLLADLVTLVWLLGMMYTTKLLDGLDGLVSGVTAIGCLVLFGVTQMADVQQAGTGLVALALAGACLGFLVFNFAPARIFLGEGGSLLTGFFLGSLAIVSGGKFATALLIMGIPILDVVWVIIRRLVVERRSPFAVADRKHLHFRLLDKGFSQRGAVLFLYGLTALFGSTALFVRGPAKLITLGAIGLLVIMMGLWLTSSRKTSKNNQPTSG